jgi:hypothetical protein
MMEPEAEEGDEQVESYGRRHNSLSRDRGGGSPIASSVRYSHDDDDTTTDVSRYDDDTATDVSSYRHRHHLEEEEDGDESLPRRLSNSKNNNAGTFRQHIP